MATKKKETWPKVIVGSHSTRTEYEDGRVEFVNDWDAMQRDVNEAIKAYEDIIAGTSAVVEQPPKKPRKKKVASK